VSARVRVFRFASLPLVVRGGLEPSTSVEGSRYRCGSDGTERNGVHRCGAELSGVTSLRSDDVLGDSVTYRFDKGVEHV
jgi:hypothetical protein